MKNEIFDNLKVEELAEIAAKEKVEIDLSIQSDEATISFRPWKPFEYKLLKPETANEEEQTNLDRLLKALQDNDIEEFASLLYSDNGLTINGKFCMETSSEECNQINADCRICLTKWLRKKVSKE